ncbi:DivIVA domain-containing protein, partial [Nostocoides japonicum]|uniref:DivIVA domain-containing protein n=1 Tax=Nostocoides japonicum TaxID=99481 RepID=UPI00065BB592
MALTPEDVLEKTFTQTQFRRGYDEREVDDFLDEVVAEMRRLSTQADDVRTQLNECREGRGLPPVDARGNEEPPAEVKQLAARNEELERLAAEYQAKISALESAQSDLRGEHESLLSSHEELRTSYADLEAKATAPAAPAGDAAA